MENEVPKKEEGAMGGETKEVVTEVAPVTAGEPKKKRPSLKEIADKVCGYVSKIDRTTKTFVVIFGIFALLFLGYVQFQGLFVAATVNGVSVSRLSVIQELERQAGRNVLDTMITKQLIQKEIKKEKVVVPAADVDAEIREAEEQIAAQGGTLEMVLIEQGMTMSDLREQIMINKALEQILADKTVVSDEEVEEYLSSSLSFSGGTVSQEQRAEAREQIERQKFSEEASLWVEALRSKATIEYHVSY